MVRPADARGAGRGAGRLLAFEVARSLYALPIESVLEVAEAERATCVPGLRTDMAGVMNWHGDPLPLVASDRLLARDGAAAPDEAPAADPEPPDRGVLREQVLVLSDRGDEAARLGIPVDRVVGLIEGRAPIGRATDLVVERRPVDGRVVAVLDPRLLVARAGDIIERAVA
jgi:chemotaxis signal transduction protein